MTDNQKTEPRTVQTGGWLDGHPIRTAARPHACTFGRGLRGACDKTIDAGDDYIEGVAGARICMEHAE